MEGEGEMNVVGAEIYVTRLGEELERGSYSGGRTLGENYDGEAGALESIAEQRM